MKDELNITLIQTQLYWEDAVQNLEHFDQFIQKIDTPTDVIILPEMFSTGFSMNSEKLSETMTGKSIEMMKKWAETKHCAICGSLIIKDSGKFYNRFMWVDDSGQAIRYDKRHLFALAGEDKFYSCGNENVIIEWKGWKIMPQVCYDLRFPVWTRRTSNQNYDLLIYVSNWPEKRSYAWETLLKARAIENQSYVAAVNRVGTDGNSILYSGNSVVINPLGKEILKFRDFEDGMKTQKISLTELQKIRTQLPFFNDVDRFTIQ